MAARRYFGSAQAALQRPAAQVQCAPRGVNGGHAAPQHELETLLTTEDVRVRLGLGSPQAVYRLVQRGMPRVLVGGVYRFRPSEINAWLDAERQADARALRAVK